MKSIVISIFIVLFHFVCFANPATDTLIKALNTAIEQVPVYDNEKLNNISVFKNLARQVSAGDVNKQYQIHLKLYEAYKDYHYDFSTQVRQ